MPEPFSFCAERLTDALTDLAVSVECVEETGSTSDDLKAAVRSGIAAARVTLRTARRQTRGRGTHGRTWHTPCDALLFSLSLPWCISEYRAGLLSIASGEAVVQACRAVGADVSIKWPNDVWAGGGKAGGILCELVNAPVGVPHLVVGVGLNLETERGRHTTHGWPITSLKEAGFEGRTSEQRFNLLAGIVRELISRLDDLKTGKVERILDDWPKLDAFRMKRISWGSALGERHQIGCSEGIDSEGFLLVRHGMERIRLQPGSHLFPDAEVCGEGV